VFRGGTVVDGTGKKPFVGDVAVKGGNILAVGPGLSVRAAREVDATGKHVMPGWTDVHTHLDVQCMWDPLLSPSGPSGVTTVVVGNCGVGAAPCRKNGRDFMISTLSAVEDIPGDVIRAGAKWQVDGKDWESFPEYLNCLETLNLACDIAAIIPHSCVRSYILGPERANQTDRPKGPWTHPLTGQEKQAIAACVKEAVEAGAVGFSLNRWWEHRDSQGVLMAGTLADADEIVLCAKAMAEAGGGTFQMHNDFKSYDDIPEDQMDAQLRKEHMRREWAWIRFISKEYGLTVNWLSGADRIPQLDKAIQAGYNIVCQTLVRPQSLIMNWQSRTHPFDSTKAFREIKKHLPVSEWYARLSDPAMRAEIISQLESRCKQDSRTGRILNQLWGPDSFRWASFYPMQEDWDYEPTPDRSIRSVAAAGGRSVLEVSYDAMMREGGKGVIWQAQTEGEVRHHYDFIRRSLLHPKIVPGISDAGAHLAIFQDGVTPTSMISFWARDRKQGLQLPLEFCVQKQARDTAYLYGLYDRGTLEVGKKADINMVDMRALKIHLPEPVNDLPTGAYRWKQEVSGYDMTVVSGVVTFESGLHTGALPGRLVRNPRRGQRPAAALPDVPAAFVGYRSGQASGAGQTTTDAVLESALAASGGASRMSTISLALEEEKKKEEQLASKL